MHLSGSRLFGTHQVTLLSFSNRNINVKQPPLTLISLFCLIFSLLQIHLIFNPALLIKHHGNCPSNMVIMLEVNTSYHGMICHDVKNKLIADSLNHTRFSPLSLFFTNVNKSGKLLSLCSLNKCLNPSSTPALLY